jgi:hypothetical protein
LSPDGILARDRHAFFEDVIFAVQFKEIIPGKSEIFPSGNPIGIPLEKLGGGDRLKIDYSAVGEKSRCARRSRAI